MKECDAFISYNSSLEDSWMDLFIENLKLCGVKTYTTLDDYRTADGEFHAGAGLQSSYELMNSSRSAILVATKENIDSGWAKENINKSTDMPKRILHLNLYLLYEIIGRMICRLLTAQRAASPSEEQMLTATKAHSLNYLESSMFKNQASPNCKHPI